MFYNFENLTGKYLSRSVFFKKVPVFSCEFFKIFKNTFFTEHLRATASVVLMPAQKIHWHLFLCFMVPVRNIFH